MVSFASRMASSSSRNGITAATGPKISSRAARSSFETGQRTVGGNQKPGPSGADPRIATGILTTTIRRVYRYVGFRTRTRRGRVVSAGTPYHYISQPNGTFLGVLKVAPANRCRHSEWLITTTPLLPLTRSSSGRNPRPIANAAPRQRRAPPPNGK